MDPILASAVATLLKESYPVVRDLAGDAADAALKKIAGEKGKEWAEALGFLKKKAEPDSEAALQMLQKHLESILERDTELRDKASTWEQVGTTR
jgi:hypothetical protein